MGSSNWQRCPPQYTIGGVAGTAGAGAPCAGVDRPAREGPQNPGLTSGLLRVVQGLSAAVPVN
jgi:hypothetical protein